MSEIARAKNAKFGITTKSGRSVIVEARDYKEAQKEADRRFGKGAIVQLVVNSTNAVVRNAVEWKRGMVANATDWEKVYTIKGKPVKLVYRGEPYNDIKATIEGGNRDYVQVDRCVMGQPLSQSLAEKIVAPHWNKIKKTANNAVVNAALAWKASKAKNALASNALTHKMKVSKDYSIAQRDNGEWVVLAGDWNPIQYCESKAKAIFDARIYQRVCDTRRASGTNAVACNAIPDEKQMEADSKKALAEMAKYAHETTGQKATSKYAPSGSGIGEIVIEFATPEDAKAFNYYSLFSNWQKDRRFRPLWALGVGGFNMPTVRGKSLVIGVGHFST